jgi:hypothetical protein
MADAVDIEQDLLDAYYASLGVELADPLSTLSWMRHFCFPEEINWQDFYGLLPVVAVWAVDPSIAPMCMSGPFRTEDCTYRIKLAAVVENYDSSYGTHSPNVPDRRIMSGYRENLDILYGNNQLSLSAECHIESVHYGIPTIPGYQVDGMTWLNSVEITFAHRYFRQLTV